MNRYILIRRLRGPAILLLIGVLALLHTSGLIHSFWHLFWPLLLILIGVLLLAERAALAAEGGEMSSWPFGGPASTGGVDPSVQTGVTPYPGQATAIVPAHTNDFGKEPDGGQS
jgi:hypothetical protein